MSDKSGAQRSTYPLDKAGWMDSFEAMVARTALKVHHIELVDIGPDFLLLEMPIGDHARQPYGLLHGGISLMLAESAASMHATWGVDLEKQVPVGIEVSGTHLNSATQGRVQAKATVLKRGRTLIRHQVQIIHLESGDLLSEVRVTNLYKTLG